MSLFLSVNEAIESYVAGEEGLGARDDGPLNDVWKSCLANCLFTLLSN